MPSEVRYLTFSPSETLAAVRELRRRRGEPLVSGAVKVAQLFAGADIRYRLVVVPNDGGPDREYLIDVTELGAALAFFCINRGIPLPASARKAIRISGDTPILVLGEGASRMQLQGRLHAQQHGSTSSMVMDPSGPLPGGLPAEP